MDIHHAGVLASIKIALLVKHLVVGQVLLGVFGNHLTAVNHSRHVVQAPVSPPRVADYHVSVIDARA